MSDMSDRLWVNKEVLLGDVFKSVVREVINPMRTRFSMALIGGLAVAHYANPPATVDIDLLVDVESVDPLAHELEVFLETWEVRPLWFSHSQKGLPRRGLRLARKDPAADVDFIVTGKDSYLKQAVQKSRVVFVQPGIDIPVICAEDLIVMKALVGRDKDLSDIDALYSALKGKLDVKYIENWIESLR